MTGSRGATLHFEASPWGRGALLADADRAVLLGQKAVELRVRVGIIGRAERGPWVVRIGTSSRVLRFAGHKLHDLIEFGLERWAAGADDTGIRWTAGPDHLSHGHPKARSPWTLCKRPALDEREAWPERSRCQDCWRALDRRVVAA
jgi:hypothetical protein